ncbi:hypothetical protein BFD03_05475 [Limosilactobacillus reuteri]|jgi:hypothetical protein|uniref:Head-tail adaptor protein n=3 Tax=Limosilactobacillus reuteri TaxID=1598 RepID=S5NE21_LIMRT|nr:hypothetical protein [Limosilactobacillus reuteri]AGR65258.1 hypothetical protein N134_06210 [Limosilactobacillus reuteri TD1]MCC4358552.1 hypothetical protein [Limosilactobacillus reuteri]MCC4363217.1 hypothetical protein [Limosilactobacillus reuteri]MCC4365057.1 hypothetical protein [Limosilactobacillus reuteri]MCH5380000.1 hypothetical protein [Limosilactobacillus reuteri]
MSFYIDMTTVLDMFKTEIKVVSGSSEGEWIDGQWQEAQGQETTYYEPFVPNDLVGQYSFMNVMRDVGDFTQYNAIWLSKHSDYPINTIVEHKNKRYRVCNIQDLSDYSNVTMYYLQSEEGQDGNKL